MQVNNFITHTLYVTVKYEIFLFLKVKVGTLIVFTLSEIQDPKWNLSTLQTMFPC